MFLICMTGCSKNYKISIEQSEYEISKALVHSSEENSVSKNISIENTAELVCPNMDRHYYRYAYTDFDTYDSEWRGEAFDGVECSDRQKYCYGQDNSPILQPKAPDGWTCRYVASMPRDKDYLREYMYFDDVDSFMVLADSLHRQKRRFTQWAYMKSWVCEEKDGCVCGGKTCPQDALCVNEECYCNNETYITGNCSRLPPELNGQDRYEVENHDEDVFDADENGRLYGKMSSNGVYINYNDSNLYYTYRKPLRDNNGETIENEYEYFCHGSKIDYPLLQHCLVLPDGRIALHLEIFDEWYLSEYLQEKECKGISASDCEERFYDERNSEDVDVERKRRSTDPLYQCGHETCVYGETCVDEHCVGMGTLNPLPSNDYVWANYLPLCKAEEGCQCSSSQCKMGQYCIENACFDNPFRRKINGKWIQYGSVMTDYYAINYAAGDDNVDSFDRGIGPLFNALWFDILTNKEAEACDNFSMPDNVDDYVCVYDGREDGCGEAPQMYVSMAGYRCNNSSGCLCGSTMIPKYAGCRNGKVDYDALYQTLACHHEMNIYLAEDNIAIAEQVDDKGWCKCGLSIVPPNMKGYVCESSHAMICKLQAGCECGTATCQYNEMCIKPGECR